jgi:hypothetical protein
MAMYRLFLFALVLVSSAAQGAEQTVWQIGKPDHSYAEFAIAGHFGEFAARFGAKPIVFEVGRSDPAKDWPYIQPGPADSVWAPSAGKPWTIRFQLPEQPQGFFTLRVELADTQSMSPPQYVVSLGGHEGIFRLTPGKNEASLGDSHVGTPQKLEIVVPASYFRKGTNEIRLTCTDGSWVQYDAVTLLNDPQGKLPPPQIQSMTAEATPFFVRRNGRLCRLIDVSLTVTPAPTEMSLQAETAGQKIEVPLKHFPLTGSTSNEIAVPDLPGPFDVKLSAVLGSQTKTATVHVMPARKWRIFVASSSHTDIGYTHVQAECAERHNQNTEAAIELFRRFPDFRWNLEVAWQAEAFVHSRTGQKLADFYRSAKQGKLGIQALYCNILTGLCSVEEACRFTWYAHKLCREHGIPYESAMISDVPTQEASLPSILAGAGIRYFSSGINNDRAYTFTEMQNRCPCWWEGPDGRRVLMMYTFQYAQASQWGLTMNLAAAKSLATAKLREFEGRKNYPYDAIFLHGALSDNQLLTPRLPEIIKEWNDRYEFPKLIMSRNAEFFQYMEKHYGDKLPVVRGSAGTYWEDGAGSSARETALSRAAHEQVANGEKFLALAERIGGLVPVYRADEINQVWRNCLLYDEHTWGAYCSINEPDNPFTKSQWKVKAQFAVDAAKGANVLLDQGTRALASLVRTTGKGVALAVFNPMSWSRTDILRVDLHGGLSGWTVLDPDTPFYASPDVTFVLVKDVPACGYRVLHLEPRASQARPQPEEATVIESRFYRVRFDAAGAITSIRDKELDRELVDPKAPYRLNQYIYVAGGKGTRMVMDPNGPQGNLKISPAQTPAKLQRTQLAELGQMMRVETSGVMAPRITSEIIVWDHIKRIDIVNRLTKTETYDKEAVYFAFPFAADKPTFRYEAPAAIVNANKDMLPGACLDWFTVQHFVEVAGKNATIAWATPDAPLVCLQDINRGKWQTKLPLTNGHLYAYVMNNYWHTNYLAGQGGDYTFRFAITSRPKTDNVASARFGWAVSNPLGGIAGRPNPHRPLPESPTSLISVAEPNVIVVGTKQADQGSGLIVRLWELSGKPTTAHVRLDPRISATKAEACNLVEDPGQPLKIHVGRIVATERNGSHTVAVNREINEVAVPVRGNGLATVRIE